MPAVMVMGYVPAAPAAGVPLSLPAVVKVTPAGSVPVLVKVGAGNPVAVTVNVPATPWVNDAVAALVMAGAWSMVNVKVCLAFEPTPLLAVMVMLYVPPVLAAGVPLSLPAEVKVTPAGSVPVSLKVAARMASDVTVKEPAAPTVKVVLAAVRMVGARPSVTNVNFWVALGVTPLLAVMVMAYVPTVLADPLSTPAEVKVTPAGSAPVSLKVGAGNPVAVTVNELAVPAVKILLVALVMTGAWLTDNVKLWLALGATPLLAVMVMG